MNRHAIITLYRGFPRVKHGSKWHIWGLSCDLLAFLIELLSIIKMYTYNTNNIEGKVRVVSVFTVKCAIHTGELYIKRTLMIHFNNTNHHGPLTYVCGTLMDRFMHFLSAKTAANKEVPYIKQPYCCLPEAHFLNLP